MIYSRNSQVLGDVHDVCSPALGLLVPCEQCCALVTTSRLSDFSEFLYNTSMHASVSLCVYALVHVSACTQGTMPPGFFWKNTSLRLQSEVKLILAIILHLSPAIM